MIPAQSCYRKRKLAFALTLKINRYYHGSGLLQGLNQFPFGVEENDITPAVGSRRKGVDNGRLTVEPNRKLAALKATVKLTIGHFEIHVRVAVALPNREQNGSRPLVRETKHELIRRNQRGFVGWRTGRIGRLRILPGGGFSARLGS